MTKVSFYHDLRSYKKDKTAQIKISIFHNGQSTLINTNIFVMPSQWNKDLHIVYNHKRKAYINKILNELYYDIEEIVLNLQRSGELQNLTALQAKKKIISILNNTSDRDEVCYFTSYFETFISKCRSKRTKEIYLSTLRRLKLFYPQINQLKFEDINKDWIDKFDTWMIQYAPSRNARNIHLRNIRAVFNSAINDEITIYYPFKKIKIKNQYTPKRSLSVENLRLLFNAEVEEYQQKYLDIFKLIFFLAGINLVDLVNLKEIKYGRIEYYRAKTGKFYSIKVEPEALEIINKYKGNPYLLNILDTYKNYHNYTAHINRALKNIGTVKRVGKGGKKIREPLFPEISTYWARHTWATIAASLDIPKDTIAHALGHGSYTTTDIYIDFNQQKVDDAMRKVIDWVLYNKK